MGYNRDLINTLYRELYTMHDAIPWVCLHDIDQELFNHKHHNVINCSIDPLKKANYLIMHYYNNVWNSRGESSMMCKFMDLPIDHLTFYCSRQYESIDAEELLILNAANYEDVQQRNKMERLIVNPNNIECINGDTL